MLDWREANLGFLLKLPCWPKYWTKLKSLMKVRKARTKVEQHSTEEIQAVAEETLSPTTMLFELEWDELVQPLASPMNPAHCQAEQGD